MVLGAVNLEQSSDALQRRKPENLVSGDAERGSLPVQQCLATLGSLAR